MHLKNNFWNKGPDVGAICIFFRQFFGGPFISFADLPRSRHVLGATRAREPLCSITWHVGVHEDP